MNVFQKAVIAGGHQLGTTEPGGKSPAVKLFIDCLCYAAEGH